MASGSAPGKRVKFGDVVRLVKETCKDPIAAGIERVIGLEHLDPGDLRVRSWNDIAQGTTFTTRVRPSQVLFGKRRAYQRKVAVADFDAICSGDIYVFESANPERLLPGLLPFICQTEAFFEHAVGTSAGSLSPRTNWSSLAEYQFSLPAMDQQRRCLAAVSAAQCFAEELRQAADRLDAVRRRAELEMVMPHGARQNADHTFSHVPDGWQLLSIREMCAHPRDIAIGPFGSNLLHADYGGRTHGVPVIFVRDIEPNAFTYRSNVFLSEQKGRSLAAHLARPGDIVITTVGRPEPAAPPGQAAVIPAGFPEAVIKADIIRVRVSREIAVPEFVASALNSPIGRQLTWRLSPGSTTRFKINATNLATIRLPLPPLPVQQRLVATLASVAHSARAIEAQRVHLRQVTNALVTTVCG